MHASENGPDQKNIHPSKVVNVGDVGSGMVLDIDEERRRISLGLKQCKTTQAGSRKPTNKALRSVSKRVKVGRIQVQG